MAVHGCNTAKVTDGIVIALYSFLKLDVQGKERRNDTHVHHNSATHKFFVAAGSAPYHV